MGMKQKKIKIQMLEWMGLNFYDYDSLQPKMSAGIINEHECMCFCLCNSGVISIYGIINRFACSIDLLHISK